jgi:hypothetical protein
MLIQPDFVYPVAPDMKVPKHFISTTRRCNTLFSCVTFQKLRENIICHIKAVSSRIASLGDEHEAITAVWLHGLHQNEGEE